MLYIARSDFSLVNVKLIYSLTNTNSLLSSTQPRCSVKSVPAHCCSTVLYIVHSERERERFLRCASPVSLRTTLQSFRRKWSDSTMQSTVSSNTYILSASSCIAPCSAFFTREHSASCSFLNLIICKVLGRL